MIDAGVFNMFYMIEGQKKWYFVDPYDGYLIYPFVVPGVAAGFAGILYPDEGNLKDFPLAEYCPYYTTTLKEGDVLL